MSAAAALALAPSNTMRGWVVISVKAAPAAAPRRMSEVLRIIREPFRLRLLPTMGLDRRGSRPCETRHTARADLSQSRWRRPTAPATHHRNRLPRQHELPQIDGYPFHPRQQHMIPAAGIKDQELAVIAEGSGVHHPAIARSRDLGAGRVASERPFSVPPRPSGAPNSRIFTPLTGNGSIPLADAKAIAGASRPGSFSAARSGRCPALSVIAGRAAGAGGRRGAVESCSSLAIRSFRSFGLARQLRGALAFGGERLLGLGLLLLALLDQQRPGAGGRRRAPADRGRAGRVRRRSACAARTSSARSADQRLDLVPHLRQHRAEHHGGAHRLQRVFGPDQQGRRRHGGRCAAARPAPRR